MRLFAIALVLALVAPTCAVPTRAVRRDPTPPVEPASHDPDREGALIGAAVGAAAGALIGALSTEGAFASLGALFGAVPGLLFGTIVGAAVDASDAFEPGEGHEPVFVRPDTTAAAPDSVP